MSRISTRSAFERSAAHLEAASADEILDWTLAMFPRRALSCSFGSPGGLVLLDIVARRDVDITVFYLDTDLLFPDTYELVERIENRYGIKATAVKADLDLATQALEHGDALWSHDPHTCCEIRKVAPQQKFLRQFDALFTGLRRNSSPERTRTPVIDWDERSEIAKINPLASWSDDALWSYVREHDVPYNHLNDRGYPSVGCTPCTRALRPGEALRDGRWPGFAKTECGLHRG